MKRIEEMLEYVQKKDDDAILIYTALPDFTTSIPNMKKKQVEGFI